MSMRAGARPDPARVRVSARAAVLLVVVLAGIASAITPLRALLAENAKLDEVQRQTRTLEQQNEVFERRILHLRDPAYLERLARECLGMVDPGETAFVTVPEEGPPPADADC